MPKNKQSNLIASVKTPNIGFINKYITNSEIRGGSLALVNYQSLLNYLFISPPPKLFFFMKNRRNRLFRVNFIEYNDLAACKQENCNIIISHFPHSPLMQPDESCCVANFYATF